MTSCSVQCDDFLLTGKKVAELLTVTCKEKNIPKANVTLKCVSAEEIRSMNATYRNTQAPTNILTFSYPDTNEHDVALCISIAEKEAEYLRVPLQDYVALLLVHAFLHVAGMDHEKSQTEEEETQRLEKRILGQCGFTSVSLIAL